MKHSGHNHAFPVVMLILALLFAFVPRTSSTHVEGEKKKAVYPNPFTIGTTFELTVPREAKIKIDVYNIRGQHVQNLFGGETGELHQAVENHPVQWDGKDKYGVPVPAGIYVCVLVSESIIVKSVKVVKIDG
ncbi:MAG: T9SS type A sorting domain-containing protein [Ignavibacteriae bacterium]|nr:T9SS type A sorting domain-containing protein [Ignavibacteriota bacterium]MCB9215575.1 T9SS type A sorting domain-containing protein [Ignavibacteria bacterium]